MFGRFGFFIHGDSILNPGWASDGCVILGRMVRQRIAASGDPLLEVVAERSDLVLPARRAEVLKA
jgi:hypothetical protein